MKGEKIALYTTLVIIIVAGTYFATRVKAPTHDRNDEQEEVITTQRGKPTFTWSYTYSSRSDVPESTVHITATYPNGATTTKKLETIQGTCNEYENRDADAYPQSQMILCYYAGLGRYYKVVEVGNVYEVRRKEFEEASPDYNPPVGKFETVATFSNQEDKAVQLVKEKYPEYQSYPSNNLPPKSVEVIETADGWRVGMYVEGSGVRGILKANCFLVTKAGTVTETGLFQGEGPAQSINLSTCTPKN